MRFLMAFEIQSMRPLQVETTVFSATLTTYSGQIQRLRSLCGRTDRMAAQLEVGTISLLLHY